MEESAAPRKKRPRSPTLDEAHEVIRALGLRDGEGDPPQGDAGTDSDLEAVPEPPTGGAPAEPAPPAGSVPTLCPAWKRGHCTGEGWCPKQHPRPGPDDGALPEVKPAAACAALRYGVAQGWILDETARGSVNIQEAVDRVTHAGQAAVALHTRGRHGGPAEGIIVEPSGMVLVLAADMVRGVLHASRVRRACPQWTIQVYSPPGAWPFSTWAVLAVMWHLAPEDAPTGTAEEIARDLHTWPADQDYPWRRPRGGLPVAPAAEGLSLAATLQRHPDKKARYFLQTGTVPATPPDSEWRWDAGEAQPLPGPWTLLLWYLPMGTLAHATQGVKGAFPQPLLSSVALLHSLQAGAAWVRRKEGKGRSSPYFPLVQGQALLHAEGMGTVEWGGDRARHGVQVDHSGRSTAHAIAAGVPPPPTDGPLFGPPTGLYEGRVEGHTEPHQGVANEPGCTVPAGAGARTAQGPHTRGPPRPAQGVRSHGAAQRRGAGPGAGAAAGALAADPHPTRGHVQPPGPPGVAAPRRGRAPRRRGGTVANAPQPVRRGRPLVPTPTPPPTTGSPGTPPAKPVPHAPGAPRRAGLPAASPARPLAGAGPGGATAGPPARHRHHGTTKGTRRRRWCRTGRHELRSGGLDGSLQAPRPRYHGAPAVQTNGPHSAGVRGRGRHHGSCGGVAGATAAPRPLPRHAAPPAGRNARANGTPHGGAAIRRRSRRRLREAYKGHRPMHQTTRGMPHSAGAPASGMRAMAHPHPGLSRRRHWCCKRQATRTSYTATPEGTGRTSWPEAAGLSGTAPPGKGHSRPCPTSTGSGAHPGLLYVGGPLAAGSPATHRQRPQQEAETGVGQPPRTGVEPRPGGASTGRVAGRRHQGHGCPGPPRGANHARLPGGYPGCGPTGTAEPAVVGLHVQPGGCAHRRLRPRAPAGPEAVVCVADCTRMFVKALREGEHHALLLQVRLKDNARAARPGVWPAAAHPADLELQLAVLTSVYHWLQAFHHLRWRGKPDRRIGSTHWQTWLQADAQRDAIRGLGPAPATRALDAAGPGRALAPHTVPLANLPFEPAAEGAIRKSVPLPPSRGATEPTKCPLCADKYYTSGAMLEHLVWHAVHAAAPADDKEAASNILQGRARRSPWHAPYARRPPPQAADHADGDEEAPGAALGTGGAAQPGSMSIPGGLAPLAPLAPPAPRAPLWAPLGTGSADAVHPDALAALANPAAMPMRDSLLQEDMAGDALWLLSWNLRNGLVPPDRSLRDTLRRRQGPAACTDNEHLITGMLPQEGGFAIMLQ